MKATDRMNDHIRNTVDKVSRENLESTVRKLAGYGSRQASSSVTVDVQEYLFSRFSQYCRPGQSRPQYQPFRLPARTQTPDSTEQRNVFFGPDLDTLVSDGRGIMLICAHYDSTGMYVCSEGEANCAFLAPGANDNASGVAALLELARLCPSSDDGEVNIMFAALGGEDVGYSGSKKAAEVAACASWPIKIVINMDMIGNNPIIGGNRVRIGYDSFPKAGRDTLVSRACARVLAQTATAYADLDPVLERFPKDSDHVPFWRRQFAVIKVEEYFRAPTHHTPCDLPDFLDYEYLSDVTRMILAFVMTLVLRNA